MVGVKSVYKMLIGTNDRWLHHDELIDCILGALTCGYRGNEVLVCCPQGSSNNPFTYHHISSQASSSSQKKIACGQPLFNNIKQGGNGGLGSHPWVARVGYINAKTGRMTYPCCGSIISDRTVLTAAHCALAKADNYQLASVRVGEYEGKGDPDCTKSFCAHPVQDIAVSHVIVHPGFERKIFKHDVALLILNIPMNFSVAALPICLLENSNVPLVGRRASLVGWGKTPGQTATPSREQLLELPIVPLDQCNKIYSQVIPVTQNQMCVGGEARKDACSGFGGAPLILLDHYSRSRYYQVGIASFGSNKCGTQGVPSVYSSVHRYAEWIRNNMV
ncbi:melanization protease 1-like isoform X3 [Zootermopsis nevadensis]|uniref:melanization protease 1-like isoform X3 n=1 Tax=Zootermopsis nevadensis TaxID=136037 RepID=UPI000B8E9DF2|nr:melanization protease 1-like isoform X3 [Zootermopsis nevadensis]